MADRFQPPLGVTDAKASQALYDVSRVLDSAPRIAFAPVIASAVSIMPGEIKRLSPRSGGMTAVLPAASASNAGASVALFVSGPGALTVAPVSGTINGASQLVFASGTYSLEISSDGSTWHTPGLADGSVTTAKLDNLSVTTGKLAADAVTQAKLADEAVEPSNLVVNSTFGVPFMVRAGMTAGVAGAADDVTIYNANAPFAFRIIDAWAHVGTAVVGSTVQLRTATGGGGSALSSALSSAATGIIRNNDTTTRSVAVNGSVFIRRSDRAVDGSITILALRIP